MAPRGPVRQKPSGAWEARYYGPDGRRRGKTFRRKTDAAAFLVTVKADLIRGTWTDPKAAKQTVEQWAEQFRRTRGRKRPGTREREESTLAVHILPAFGRRTLGSLSRADVQEWVDSLTEKGLAPGTVRREFGVLHKLLEEAVDAEAILRNPCRKIEFPEDEQPQEQRFLDVDEVEALYRSFDPRYRAMVLVGCYAGLRLGEQAGLKVERVLFMRRQIDVQEGLFEPLSGPVQIGRLKTRYSRGRVDIPPFLADELAAYIRRYPPEPERLIFTSPDGEPLRPRNWRRRFWNPAVQAAGLGLPCTPD